MKTIVCFWFVLGALSASGKVLVTKPGQKAILECGVNTFTKQLEWYHEKDLLHRVSHRGFPSKGKGEIVTNSKVKQTKLEIVLVKKEYAGKFICIADENRQEHTLLVASVSVKASPSTELQLGSEAELDCQVEGLDQGSTATWKRPDGSLHSGILKSVDHSDEGDWECTFPSGGETYSQILAIKVKGPTPVPADPTLSQGTTCVDCVTHPPSVTAFLLGLSWWVWVAVGAGCLVVVLLLVFVIILCKRIKKKQGKFQAMKNGRQPLKPKKYCKCDSPAAAAKPQQKRRREKPSALPPQPLLML
ncbi:uncharacterized protein LOC129109559 [Anoplopoma fimbria]|uniref:uncharacterized protein LOC129109559 n=1 Tax=Anoplopoma fimbria TaxID=229290 RepID=UPI0023ECB6FA|nr:uncharacterized protein LOC129109559 [Anoplopoma fimbria]